MITHRERGTISRIFERASRNAARRNGYELTYRWPWRPEVTGGQSNVGCRFEGVLARGGRTKDVISQGLSRQ